MAQFYLQWYVTEVQLSNFNAFCCFSFSWKHNDRGNEQLFRPWRGRLYPKDAQPTKVTCIGNFNFWCQLFNFNSWISTCFFHGHGNEYLLHPWCKLQPEMLNPTKKKRNQSNELIWRSFIFFRNLRVFLTLSTQRWKPFTFKSGVKWC